MDVISGYSITSINSISIPWCNILDRILNGNIKIFAKSLHHRIKCRYIYVWIKIHPFSEWSITRMLFNICVQDTDGPSMTYIKYQNQNRKLNNIIWMAMTYIPFVVKRAFTQKGRLSFKINEKYIFVSNERIFALNI